MHSDLHQEWLQNHTFDELVVGQGATITRVLTDADISGFAAVSGDLNPTHLDDAYARSEGLRGRTAHGMWSGAMISTLMGTVYPGPGTVYVSQSMQFLAAARSGDKLEIAVKVKSKDAATQHVVLDCVVRKADGKELMVGEAVVKAPSRKQRVPSASGLRWHVFDAAAGVQKLLKQATQHERIRCAIVHPCDSESLRGALDAAREGLFTPVIVAPRERLLAVAAEAGRRHVVEMAEWSYFSHWNLEGLGPEHRYSRAGGANAVGENLHAMASIRPPDDWQAVIREAHAGLMDSPGHRANILHPAHTHVGLAIAYSAATGQMRMAQEFTNHYVTLNQWLPLSAERGARLVVDGVIASRNVGNVLLDVAWEPLPRPLSVSELNATNTYTAAAQSFDTRAVGPTFREEVTLDNAGRPGIYHIRIFGDMGGEQALLLSHAIWVE